ncbi:MAG: hypothetical protein J5647_02985 [Spirochaetaceae bacterium]|nr:hypothetical protein [Spirochaetaceae bacterium]
MTCALEKNTFPDCLISFGLTRQEAVIYETLLKHGEMTGYEVSKETGISRSNAYASLAGLADKGASYLIKGEAVKYTPVPVPQFVESTLASLAEKGEFLKAHAPAHRDTTDGYITIQGAANIRGKIRQMLADMEHRLYMMAPSDIVAQFCGELSEKISGGKKIVLLTERLPAELTELSGKLDEAAESAVYITDAEPGQIRMIVDSAYVMTGEFTGSESDTCLYSGQKNLVSVMKEALKNKITLLNLGGYK